MEITREDISIVEIINYSTKKKDIIEETTQQLPYIYDFYIKTFTVKDQIDYFKNIKLLFYFYEGQVIMINQNNKSNIKTRFCLRGHMKLFPMKVKLSSFINEDHEELAKRIIYLRPLSLLFKEQENKINLMLNMMNKDNISNNIKSNSLINPSNNQESLTNKSNYSRFINSIRNKKGNIKLKEFAFDEIKLIMYKIHIPKGEKVFISYNNDTSLWVISYLDKILLFNNENDLEKIPYENKYLYHTLKSFGLFWLDYINSLNINIENFQQALENITLCGIYINPKVNIIFKYTKHLENNIYFYCATYNNTNNKILTNREYLSMYNREYTTLPISNIVDISQAYRLLIKYKLKICPIEKVDKLFNSFNDIVSLIEYYQTYLDQRDFRYSDDGYIILIYKLTNEKEKDQIISSIDISFIKKNNKYESSTTTDNFNLTKELQTIIYINSKQVRFIDTMTEYIKSLFIDLNHLIKNNTILIEKEYKSYVKHFIKEYASLLLDIRNKRFYIELIENVFRNLFDKFDIKGIHTNKIPLIIRAEYKRLKYENDVKNFIIENQEKFMKENKYKFNKDLFKDIYLTEEEIIKMIDKYNQNTYRLNKVHSLKSVFDEKCLLINMFKDLLGDNINDKEKVEYADLKNNYNNGIIEEESESKHESSLEINDENNISFNNDSDNNESKIKLNESDENNYKTTAGNYEKNFKVQKYSYSNESLPDETGRKCSCCFIY